MKIFLLFFLLLSTIILYPQSINYSSSIEKLDSILISAIEENSPGCAVMVIYNGRKIFEKGYGLVNINSKEKISSETNFYLGSIAKQFTAIAVMLLAEKNKLKTDDLLIKYFPNLPAYAKDIRIFHLLTHTSGLIDHYSIIGTDISGLKNSDVIKVLNEQDSLLFQPGEKYSYSNPNYVLLAMLVEKVSGKSYADFIRDNIFDPLRMRNSIVYDDKKPVIKNRATGYNKDGSKFFTENDYNLFTTGAGGIYSSLDDLYKWDQALYEEKLVKYESLNRAFSKHKLNNGEEVDYGFGWVISRFDDGIYKNISYVSHTGALKGFRAYIIRVPYKKFSFIILSNRSELPISPSLISELFFGD